MNKSINNEQMQAAAEAMTGWLAHPQELGREPARLECAGEFDLHELHYYIFKYKQNRLGKWLLGVCGGFEADSLEHCGHVFSEMQEYHEATAEADAIALVETVRKYWTEQAQSAEERKKTPGTFLNFVLLEKPEWDKAALVTELKEHWGIEDEPDDDDDKADDDSDDILIISYQGAMISVALMPGPIPEGEVVAAASSNYMWPEGQEVVRRQQAHLMIAVMGQLMPPLDGGSLLVKLVAAVCQQPGALGVYANDTVYPVDYYQHFAGMLDEDAFPIFNLVWFGLYKDKGGLCGYTNGLSQFGYDEIEVLNTAAQPSELHDFLSSVAGYVLECEAVLQDGETIGFTEEQKLPITKSRGVAVDGDSLKIAFPE